MNKRSEQNATDGDVADRSQKQTTVLDAATAAANAPPQVRYKRKVACSGAFQIGNTLDLARQCEVLVPAQRRYFLRQLAVQYQDPRSEPEVSDRIRESTRSVEW